MYFALIKYMKKRPFFERFYRSFLSLLIAKRACGQLRFSMF